MRQIIDDNKGWQVDSQFALDVSYGLLKEQKQLSSKYFYDTKGAEIFNQITRHPDYYLTQCEVEILEESKSFLSQILANAPLNLVELGPGEGLKAEIMMNQFLNDGLDFTYYAIDISEKYLSSLSEKLSLKYNKLHIKTIEADYSLGLKWLNSYAKKRTLVLFLGSSIGNFTDDQTRKFLKKIRQDLHPGDYFFIGFDLKKSIQLLMQAYADEDGLTKAFNLNLLDRMNRELKTNFDLSGFDHFAKYNMRIGAMESFLISLKEQTVHSNYLNQNFHFRAFESIHVERSYKYVLPQIEAFAKEAGFVVAQHFLDKKRYFVNSLWQVS